MAVFAEYEAGRRVVEIAEEMGLTRARIYQMIGWARRCGVSQNR